MIPEPQDTGASRLVLVTGPSGAGRSTAIHALEDIGYEAIDNIPLALVPRLLRSDDPNRPVALGIDTRTRDFTPGALVEMLRDLREREDLKLEVVYLDCKPEVLLRRFSETRRRHPLAPMDSPETGIADEMALLAPVRSLASVLIDTTDMSPHDLRGEIERWFGTGSGQGLAVSVLSFSYKRGLPPGADIVFDCRFLDNPHWVPELRPLSGLDRDVAQHVSDDPRFAPFTEKVLDLLELLLPAVTEEGKSHFTIAFGCTGGKHRSVTMAEFISGGLADAGWQVSVRHRELERRGVLPEATRPPARDRPRNGDERT